MIKNLTPLPRVSRLAGGRCPCSPQLSHGLLLHTRDLETRPWKSVPLSAHILSQAFLLEFPLADWGGWCMLAVWYSSGCGLC